MEGLDNPLETMKSLPTSVEIKKQNQRSYRKLFNGKDVENSLDYRKSLLVDRLFYKNHLKAMLHLQQ